MNEYRYIIGDKILERYEVRQIMPGGMGIVYICQDYKEKIPFALKTFYDKYLADKAAKERFINEATTWIKLDYHINVVQAERVEIIGGYPFIVLECVLDEHGMASDLARRLSKGPLEIRTAINYAIQACLGMNHIQHKIPGLVHRDIKPSNILISHNNIAKVTDFGIAAVFHHSLAKHTNAANVIPPIKIGEQRTRTGQMIGTPDYMSPEQYYGQVLDIRSDIYSFGCVFYEMLTGKNFLRYSLLQSEKKSELFAGIHPDIVSILQRCLSYEPEQRFQSFYETGNALGKCYKSILNDNPEIKIRHQIIPGNWLEFVMNSFIEAANFTTDYDRSVELGKSPANLNLLSKGLSLMDIERYEEALQCYERWISDYGDIESDRFNKFIQSYWGDKKTEIAKKKKSTANAYILKANALSALGRGKEAIACYEKALILDPEDYNAWYNLGENLFNVMHDSKGAVDAYRKALKLNPRDDMAWASLGYVVSEMEDIEEAIKCYDKALEINPNLVSALGNKGVALLRKNMKTEALECFQRIINNEPGNALAWYNKAITLPESRSSEILGSLERAVQLDPENVHFQDALNQAKRYFNR